MSAWERSPNKWVAKFQYRGKQEWVPAGPWPTKRLAELAETAHRERLANRRTDETCASFGDRWLDEWPRPADSTRRHYKAAVERFTAEHGSVLLCEFTTSQARSWALGVPRNVSKTIHTMFEDARHVDLVDRNPFTRLRLPATEKTEEVLPPTEAELDAINEACMVLGGYAEEFRSMITFSAWTGLRAGELQALQWESVGDTEILVRRAMKTDGSYGPPKNGKARIVPLIAPARVLADLPRRPDDLVFHSRRGMALNKGNMYYAWKEVRAASRVNIDREAADLPGLRWHDLRHHCATQLLERGLSHFDVSVMLGHTDGGALVMARYGHPSKAAARQRLLAAFEPGDGETGSYTGSSVAGKAHG